MGTGTHLGSAGQASIRSRGQVWPAACLNIALGHSAPSPTLPLEKVKPLHLLHRCWTLPTKMRSCWPLPLLSNDLLLLFELPCLLFHPNQVYQNPSFPSCSTCGGLDKRRRRSECCSQLSLRQTLRTVARPDNHGASAPWVQLYVYCRCYFSCYVNHSTKKGIYLEGHLNFHVFDNQLDSTALQTCRVF